MRPTLLILLVLAGVTGSLSGQLRQKPMPTSLLAVTADAVTPVSLTLHWNAQSGAGSYTVSRGISAGGPFVPIATVPATVTQLADQGLVPGTVFYYQIQPVAAPAVVVPSPRAMTTGLTPTGTTTMQLALPAIAGWAQTADAPLLSVTKSCPPPVQTPNYPYNYNSNCVWNWAPVPGAVGYRVYIHNPPQLAIISCSLSATAIAVTPAATYQASVDTRDFGTYCRQHDFRAIYEIRNFPVPGATLTKEGPQSTAP